MTDPQTRSTTGLLGDLGPAAQWCIAGEGTLTPHPTGADFDREVSLLCSEGLSGAALAVIRQQRVHPSPATQQALRADAYKRAAAQALVVAEFSTLLPALRESSVDFAVMKGPAVAMSDGAQRPFTDIDLIVRVTDFEAARATLWSNGFTSDEASLPWPWYARLAREGQNFHSPAGGNVDLHHHLPPWALGDSLSGDELLRAATRADIPGLGVLPLVCPAHSILIAGLHVLNDRWKGRLALQSWRDLVRLSRAFTPGDLTALFKEYQLEGLQHFLARNLVTVSPHNAIVLGASTSSTPPYALSDLRLRVLAGENNSPLFRHRASWLFHLPLPNAAAYALGSIAPSASYVHGHDGSYLAYWRRLAVETVRTLRGADHRSDQPKNRANHAAL